MDSEAAGKRSGFFWRILYMLAWDSGPGPSTAAVIADSFGGVNQPMRTIRVGVRWPVYLAMPVSRNVESHAGDEVNDTPQQPTGVPAPLGLIEPHAGLLVAPPEGQLLYKMMTVENLLRSIAGSYLHFNRVDSYRDLDPNDGAQLPRDQASNAQVTFAQAPSFSADDYYNQSRTRTYTCCFSLENTDFIWRTYATGGSRGKICVVFDFAKLRARLNQTLTQGDAALEYNGIRCRQIFSINYGVVEYVPWDTHRANAEHLPNPIKYTYLKSDKYGVTGNCAFRCPRSASGSLC